MALNNILKTLETRIGNRPAESEPGSEEDLEELESDVKKMAEKILECRATIPDQLKITLDSILSPQRPNLPGIHGSEPGPSAEHNANSVEMGLDEGRRTVEKIRIIKEQISNNISAMPAVVKRMKECISRIEKLDSCNGIICPAFKKRKLVDPMKVDFHN
ncbi:uncharacterized protein LOC111313861 [Durio zibethinus]|uniref:Uncharacterized protein LOC111313861 n=1 Tax=Durio zibethinus TaxID=66656 RepID=A0A6P6B054_DURZI|nr:uncharacterized protein LOC111313861 [Durio zibethinus]